MRPIEEIASVLAQAKAFAATVPEGDWRQDAATAVTEACDTLLQVLPRRVTPGSPEAEAWVLELRLLLANVSRLLVRIEATQLGDRIRRTYEAHAGAARSTKGKRGQVALRERAQADFSKTKGSVPLRTFARRFALEHNLSEETVRDWLRGKRG